MIWVGSATLQGVILPYMFYHLKLSQMMFYSYSIVCAKGSAYQKDGSHMVGMRAGDRARYASQPDCSKCDASNTKVPISHTSCIFVHFGPTV